MHRALIAFALVLLSILAGTASAETPAGLRGSGFAAPSLSPSGLLLPQPLGLEIGGKAAFASDASTGSDRRLVNDWTLVAKEYGFAVVGSAVAGALGFYIGSGIETAIVGDADASKGWLSFTAIRYDNFSGAFWGGATGILLGSSFTTYFVGQTDEEDGSLLWTMVGTGLATAGALYIADLMGVEDERDWKPFIPLLALPTIGGVAGFNISRWFSDRKRESVVGPDAGLHLQLPRLALDSDGFSFQALNLTF